LNYSRKHSLALMPFAAIRSARGADAQMAHMSTIVNTDNIFVGSEFIPRRTDLSPQPIVRGGASMGLASSSAFDDIEVAGVTPRHGLGRQSASDRRSWQKRIAR
jgi:hypothetical protein